MGFDLESGYSNIEKKMKASRTYLDAKAESIELEKKAGDNLEQAKQKVTSSLDQIKDQKKRFQRQMKTQMDQMLSMVQFNGGSGSATMRYIKTKFIIAALRIEPKIFDIINKETIHALGCSQQQTYSVQSIYIKVKSVDLQRLLTRDPNDEVAAIAYENVAPAPNQIPYSMNRQMWDRLQNLNIPQPFYGRSGQKLFDITYVQQDNNGITGDFFKIDLVNKTIGINKVSNFIVDYYKAIKIIDISNLFEQLMDQISGAVSFDAKVGFGELEVKNKFLLILQRILGLCFDSKQEIDISGNSKVAELDGIDDSFFEFTDIDLKYINDTISNIQNGIVEFEDCENVKLPVDSQSIINSLLKFNKITKIEDEQTLAERLTETLTDNEKWKILVPNSVDINLNVDLSFLTNLPKAIMMALLSPKVLLPLFIMAKAINQMVGYAIENLMDFMKSFKKYCINIMSKIGSLFIQELFEIIKKDILTLISSIRKDLIKEKVLKKYAMILKLIELITIISKFVNDWRKCKSVVDEILALLTLVTPDFGGGIPAPLLAASELLQGVSPTRAFINVISEYQKLGLPTGPMPDGSPNIELQSAFALIKGLSQEHFENNKVQVFSRPLTVTPAFVTLPSGKIFGKWY
jgi:hypothetical protein